MPAATPRKRGRDGCKDRERRRKLYPLCAECKREGRDTLTAHIDHVVPLHKGGPDTDENTQGLCEAHHQAKTDEDMGRQMGFNECGKPLDPSHPWSAR